MLAIPFGLTDSSESGIYTIGDCGASSPVRSVNDLLRRMEPAD
jgi:hypothetical protein